MNNHEKVQLLFIYRKCSRNAREETRMYAWQYPDWYHPHYNYVQKLEKLLIENGKILVLLLQFPLSNFRDAFFRF